MESLQSLNMVNTEILVLFLIALLTYSIWAFLKRPTNLPPGPRGLPIVGYLPFMKEKAHLQFNDLAKTYGDIISFYTGSKLMVVLNSYEAIKEALVKQSDIFAGRPLKESSLKPNEAPGIFLADGEIWKDYKRFTLSTLRDFGFGKLSLEPRVKEEIYCLLDVIKGYNEQPQDIANLLRMSISNVICTIKFGQRFDYNDKDFLYLMNVLTEHLNRASPIDYRLYFPNLAKIPGMKRVLNRKPFQDTAKLLVTYISEKIKTMAKTHEPGNDTDFVSAWLTEASNRANGKGENFKHENLANVILSLFVAGSDTTANTLRWALLHLMKQPHIQTRIQKEIDDVIGHERLPSITDKEQMPYTEATIMEIHRIASLVPLALMHVNSEATTIRNFNIPKRSYIFPNLWAVHFDPKTYPEPEIFRPERFLDANGKLIKNERLIPFSLGKRQCLGEGLARMEVFLYFTSMLQNFTFVKPPEDTLSFDYKMATVAIPKPFRTIAKIRAAPKRQN